MYVNGNAWKLPVCTGTEGCSVSWPAIGCLSSNVASTGNIKHTRTDYSPLMYVAAKAPKQLVMNSTEFQCCII